MDGEAFVSGPLSDRVRGRIALKTLQSGKGWQKSLTRDDRLGEQDIGAARGILDFDLSDRVSLELNLHYVKDRSDNPAPAAFNGQELGLPTVSFAPHNPLQNYTSDLVTLTSTPPWFTGHEASQADWTNSYTSAITGTTWNIRPRRDNELKGVSARLGWKLGAVDVTSLTAYDEFDRVEAFEGDGGDFVDTSNINTTGVNVFSQELRFSGGTDRFVWISGLYYSKDKVDEGYHFFMPDSVYGNASVPWNVAPFNLSPILELDTKYRQHSDSKAAFGHIEWSFAERWKLTAGLRYTEEKRDWAGCTFSAADNSLGNFLNTLFGATLQAGDCGTIDDDPNSPTNIFNVLGTPDVNDAFHVFEDEIDTRKWMWKLGIDRHLSDDVLLYGVISRGFKSGGFNGAASNVTQQLAPYGPEKLTAYELGAKMTLLDRTMQINASAFYYDYRDKQEADAAVTFVGNISGLTNVPKSRIEGAELEVHWAPVRGLNIDAAAAWLDTKVIEWQATDPFLSVWPDVVTFDASGTELPQAPAMVLQRRGQLSVAGRQRALHAGRRRCQSRGYDERRRKRLCVRDEGIHAGQRAHRRRGRRWQVGRAALEPQHHRRVLLSVGVRRQRALRAYGRHAAYRGCFAGLPMVKRMSRNKVCKGLIAASALAAIAFVTLAGAAGDATEKADLILTHGKIKTPAGWAEALAVRKGVILAVGDAKSVEALRAPGTQVIDLGGDTVLPGLHDVHVHPVYGGVSERRCRIAQGSTLAATQAGVKACAQKLTSGAWVIGGQWDASALGRAPNRATLDRAAPDNPVFLEDTSGHSVWVNSKALAIAGISRQTQNPVGGIIERDSKGEPTGVMRESAVDLIKQHIPLPSAQELETALAWSLQTMLSYGITSFTEASVGFTAGSERELAAYAALADAGVLKQRARLCLTWAPEPSAEAVIAARNRYARDRLATDCVKIFLDGVPTDSHTAAMLQPYHDAIEGRTDEAGRMGMLMVEQKALDEAVTRFDRMGLTVKFHAAGDAAVSRWPQRRRGCAQGEWSRQPGAQRRPLHVRCS